MPKAQPIPERLWGRVDKQAAGGCWEWRGSTRAGGYGVMVIGSRLDGSRRLVATHRLAYELLIGEIPEELELDHLCCNKRCCNPAHLEPVPHHVNVRRGVTGVDFDCKRGHSDLKYSEAAKRYFCRTCRREASQRYRETHRDQINERQRELYHANQDRIT